MPLTDDELEALLLQCESDRTERKRNASDMDRIREAVCAFANDLPDHRAPGVVYVGVEDVGTCSNLAIDDDLLRASAKFGMTARLRLFPPWRFAAPPFESA